MLNVFLLLPFPRLFGPKRTVLVAARLDETQKIVICHVVLFNRKSRRLYFVSFKFVVPAEFLTVRSLQAQRRCPGWNID